MNFAKKIIVDGETVFDITSDTVTPDKVLKGESFHNNEGNPQEGAIETYSGETTITKNQTLSTEGRYITKDIEIKVDIPIVNELPTPTADSPRVVILDERLYLKTGEL